MNRLCYFMSIFFLALLCARWGAAQSMARYVGRLSNGQMISGAALTDWHSRDASPRLDNQPLLDPQNPYRWLRDRSLRLPSKPEAFVEMFTGDCLPGKVIESVTADPGTLDGNPAHLVVEPTCELKAPRPQFPAKMRIVTDSVRRIVWRRASQTYEPGTVFFRDGRSVSFRAVRVSGTSVSLLRDDGRQEASFDQIAELHFPDRDIWEAYYDELALLCADGDTRLLQIETIDGLAATTSHWRTFPLAEGNPSDSTRWLHGVQPAWSLDVLWVPHRNIAIRRSFAAHEVPLSRLSPSPAPSASPLRGPIPNYATNRNVEGGSLVSSDQEHGWGFGVLGASELHFPVPGFATGFQGRVGLDRIARSGGAIQAKIFLDGATSTPVWQSPPIVGTGQLSDWGNLVIPTHSGKTRSLILQIDPLLRGAPQGADPLDIRDAADWVDPLLLLDEGKLRAELARRTWRRVFAWNGWELDDESKGVLAWRHSFDLNAGQSGASLGVSREDQTLRLMRRVQIASGREWLVIVADQMSNTTKRATLEVRVDGEPISEWEVPSYSTDPAARQVLVVPLAPFQKNDGQQVSIEILQSMTPRDAPVYWRAITFTNEPPTLFRLFDDDGVFAAAESDPNVKFAMEVAERHSGKQSVKISAPGQITARLASHVAVRDRPGLGEYRYLRFAFRKLGQGRAAVELNRVDQPGPPIRYDAGQGEPSYGSAARVWNLELPDQWIVITRDLYSDFGKSDIDALTLGAPDGEQVLFDHLYLARSERDFDLLSHVETPEVTNQEARRALAKPVLDRVTPATVAIDFGGRYATGALVSREGDVLTAGHAITSPGNEVMVHLRDGRKLKARTGGICRDLDLGLVRIQEQGEWPTIDIGDARNTPKDQLYVGVAHRQKVLTEDGPAAHIVGLRRVLQGLIWTDFDLVDWSAGGPLVDREGRLIGIQRGQSQFGGFVYTQLLDVHSVLPRLRNGEVWGVWPAGSGPMFGAHLETTPTGCRVTEVYPETPAMNAGLRAGDWVVKIDGRSVRRLDDVYQRLGETDAGQQVALEIRRGSDTIAMTLPLIPRTP